MKKLICRFRGHRDIPVKQVGVVPRPGGIMPSIDGLVAYAPDPAGDALACIRCRRVVP